jgi:hypothetical protein
MLARNEGGKDKGGASLRPYMAIVSRLAWGTRAANVEPCA